MALSGCTTSNLLESAHLLSDSRAAHTGMRLFVRPSDDAAYFLPAYKKELPHCVAAVHIGIDQT